MFRRQKVRREGLPWYRAPNYKGSLTEAEKRELDSFRLQESQGGADRSANCGELPDEVQSYLSKIWVERYDQIQEALVGRCFLVSAIGLFLLLNHFRCISPNYDSTEVFFAGAFLLLAPWIYYPIKWKKNAETFPDNNEGIRTEWELNYINKTMSDTS